MRNVPIVMIPPVVRGEVGGPSLAPIVKVVAVVGSWHVLLPHTGHGEGFLVVLLLLVGHLDWGVRVIFSESVYSVFYLTMVTWKGLLY
jgi:hypothetical protein